MTHVLTVEPPLPNCCKLKVSHLFIPDVLQGVGDDGDAHVNQVRRRHLEHLLRKLFPVLVDLLKTEKMDLVEVSRQNANGWFTLTL